ncbi:PAS domain-containing sensor histidine kinase [Candidatus Dojkabacteria bacterium]|nr:PAS domain-containing sensor histidine kinase [Candidatus Dojkabacteria bacterium]
MGIDKHTYQAQSQGRDRNEIDPINMALNMSRVATAFVPISSYSGHEGVMVNKLFTDLFGCDSDEINSVVRLSCVLRNDQWRDELELKNYIQRIKDAPNTHEIRTLSDKNGGKFMADIEYSIISNNDDEPFLLSVTIRNVTEELQKAEDLRRESERRLFDFINKAPFGIILTSDGLVISLNPAALKILGYAEGDSMAIRETGSLYAYKEERDIFKERLENSDDGIVDGVRVYMKRKDGELVLCSFTAVRQMNNTGEEIGYALMFRDVTQEEEARRLELTLAETRQREIIRQENHDKYTHDIANIISVMRLQVYSAMNAVGSEKVLKNIQGIAEQINRLYDYFQLDCKSDSEGQISYHFNEMKVESAIQFFKNVVSSYEGPAQEKGLNFGFQRKENIEGNGKNCVVSIDKNATERLLTNLLNNAIKYTIEGSVLMDVYTDSDNLIIECKDTGCGIPKNEQKRVFESGYRAANSSRTEGKGLGLSIVKEIVEAHKGKIELQSTPGEGSTFTVKLPLIVRE